MKTFKHLALATFIYCLANHAQAAVITWSTFGFVSGPSDVLMPGSVVEAQYATANGAGEQIVNGVTFTEGFSNYATPAGTAVFAFPGDTGSPAYNAILNGSAFDNSGNTPTSVLTLTALTVGTKYQVELWGLDDRSQFGVPTRTENFDDNTGDFSTTFLLGSNTIILGAFRADAPTQIINVNGAGQSAHSLNAFAVSVPEPAAWVLAPLGCLVLAAWQRREKVRS